MRLTRNRVADSPPQTRAVAESNQETASVPDRLRRQIAEYPRVALGAAAVVGVLAGWWVKR